MPSNTMMIILLCRSRANGIGKKGGIIFDLHKRRHGRSNNLPRKMRGSSGEGAGQFWGVSKTSWTVSPDKTMAVKGVQKRSK